MLEVLAARQRGKELGHHSQSSNTTPILRRIASQLKTLDIAPSSACPACLVGCQCDCLGPSGRPAVEIQALTRGPSAILEHTPAPFWGRWGQKAWDDPEGQATEEPDGISGLLTACWADLIGSIFTRHSSDSRTGWDVIAKPSAVPTNLPVQDVEGDSAVKIEPGAERLGCRVARRNLSLANICSLLLMPHLEVAGFQKDRLRDNDICQPQPSDEL